MKPSPAPAFVMPQSEFLLEFLIILLDNPALLGESNQILQFRTRWQGRKPVLCGLGLRLRPLDQQPFFRMWLSLPVITMGRSNSNGGEARTQFMLCSLTPGHCFPCFDRKHCSQLLY